MAEAKLTAVIEAEDRASATIAKVGKNAEGLGKKITDMKPMFASMAVGGTIAFGAISAAMFSSIKSANEAAAVTAQLNAVIKSTGGVAGVTADAVLKLSTELQKTTTFNDEVITSAQNLLLTFTKIGKDVFPEATKTILDMSTALGQDTKASAIQLGKALNDPIRGVSALRKVGVSFTEEQQKQIEVLVESGKTMEAQRLILAELATEFGGSASAQAQTFEGRVIQLKNRLDDMQQGIGEALIPIIEKMVEKIGPVIDKIITWIENNPKLTATILIVSAAIAGLVTVVGLLGLAVIAFQAVSMPMLLTFGGILAVIGGIVAIAIIFKDRWVEIFAMIEEKTQFVELLKIAWDNIVQTFNEFLLPALKQLWEALTPLKPFLEAMAKVAGVILVGGIVLLVKAVEGWIQIFTILLSIAIKVGEFFTKVFVGTINTVISAVEKAITAVTNLINKLQQLNVMQGAKNFAKNVVGGAKHVLGIDDGVISPDGKVVSTHPDDWLIATKNPGLLGGGKDININISGAVLSTEAARVLGDMIVNDLRLHLKF